MGGTGEECSFIQAVISVRKQWFAIPTNLKEHIICLQRCGVQHSHLVQTEMWTASVLELPLYTEWDNKWKLVYQLKINLFKNMSEN